MINKVKLEEALEKYKKEFLAGNWENEKFKWEIVKQFQNTWNIDADDFPAMLEQSLEPAGNLLTSANFFPKGMICGFAKVNPQFVKNMFINLFDESRDVYERINEFKEKSSEMLKEWEEYHDSYGKVHYQNENSISTYLWLRYPDRYYIYKISEMRAVNEVLEAGYEFKNGEYEKNVHNFIQFYDELHDEIVKDDELIEMLKSHLTDDCYPDPECRTLTFDIAFYISRHIHEKPKKDTDNVIGDALADSDIESINYWAYSPGYTAEKWEEFYKDGLMRIGWGEIGDLKQYSSKDDMKAAMKDEYGNNKSYKNAALATWNFASVMKPGDVIYVKNGIKKIVGKGIVESDYYFDENYPDFSHCRKVKWTDKGEWTYPGQLSMKTLTNITKHTDMVDQLKTLFDIDADDDEEQEIVYPTYTVEQFLDEVYLDEEKYLTLVDLIKDKRNVILQGAPGVGKTFIAKRLAYSMIGSKNQERVMLIQFHQSYSYEDFIEGLRPSRTGMGFDIKTGAFLEFCDRAREDIENEYFFIIDEINRGNLSKIFGELFMLIENDKRGNELQLLYSNDKFSVPKNVYIIGMMNTADRSLALLDYALRRRFAFYEIKPGFNTEGFLKYKDSLDDPRFNRLIDAIERLNQDIKDDETLGEGFCIGHSYFCNIEEVTDKKLSSIVEFEIIPLLKEYWFDEPSKIKEWSERLRSSIK